MGALFALTARGDTDIDYNVSEIDVFSLFPW